MFLPEAHVDLIQKEILRTNAFFEARLLGSLEKIIPPGSIIVDAGSNIGNHTVFFSKILRAQQVISFEPQRTRFRILMKNLQLNELDGVQAFNRALGESEGHASISGFKPWNAGGTSFHVDIDGAFRVSPLDAFRFPIIDFMKIDVEGFQIPLLLGARETILRTRPKIMVELRKDEKEFDETNALLRQFGAKEPAALSSADWLFVFE